MVGVKMKSFYLLFALAIVIIGVLCSCIKDVSDDPRYNYGYKYNHVYKTIDVTLLVKSYGFKTLYFISKMNEAGKRDIGSYLSLKNNTVVLPKGILFRVEQLIRDINPEQSTLFVKVRILNGYFKNIQATCFLNIYDRDSVENEEKSKELWVPIEMPDTEIVIDLGEMPEYKDEKLIPEPEPITYLSLIHI